MTVSYFRGLSFWGRAVVEPPVGNGTLEYDSRMAAEEAELVSTERSELEEGAEPCVPASGVPPDIGL